MALIDQYKLTQNADFRGIIRAAMLNRAKEIINTPSLANANGQALAKTVARGDGGTTSAAAEQFANIAAIDSRINAATAIANVSSVPDSVIMAIVNEFWNWVAGS